MTLFKFSGRSQKCRIVAMDHAPTVRVTASGYLTIEVTPRADAGDKAAPGTVYHLDIGRHDLQAIRDALARIDAAAVRS